MSGMKDFSGTGLARWMVGCDTVTSGSNEAALLAQVAEWLEKAGFAVFLDGYDEKDPGKCSLSAHLHPDCGGGALCLAGHVDTVPLGTTPWKHDPFSGEIIDGSLYGRGSCDMKSGAAVMLAAALSMAPLIRDRDLVLHLYGGEERGCLGSFHMPEREFRNIAAVVVGEPTGARPLAGHKGALWLTLSSSGRTSHASMPEEGDSALAKMLPAATPLLDFVPVGTHPFMGRGTSVLSTLHSGLNSNSVPDSAVLTMDIRTVPGMDHEKLREEIRGICGDGMVMDTTLDIPPVWTEPEHPWMKKVYALYEALSGRQAQVAAVQFFTDAAAVRTRLPEVPVVIFGPGDSAMAHQVDEACPVSQITFMETVCRELIRDWYAL